MSKPPTWPRSWPTSAGKRASASPPAPAPAHGSVPASPTCPWKTGYAGYVEELLPRLREGGVILVDNVLWGGAVVDAARQDEDTVAIRAFNDAVARDPRVDAVMIPLSDGLTLLRKR